MKMQNSLRCFRVWLLLFLVPVFGVCAGELGPLSMKHARLVPEGNGEIDISIAFISDYYNHFEERDSDRTRGEVPRIELRLGMGRLVEIDLGFENLVIEEEGKFDKWGAGDVVVGAKVGLGVCLADSLEMAVFFETKVPSADDERGFGTDQTDFAAGFLGCCDLSVCEALLDLGVSIMDDPRTGRLAQDDVFTYGAGLSFDLLSGDMLLLASVEGALSGESVNRRGSFAGGVIIRSGDWRWYLGSSSGYTRFSEDWSVRAGMSKRFRMF